MVVQFATSDRARALGFLKQLYPGQKITDTEESAKRLLDFVERDVVRIQDPAMHPRPQVVQGENWDDSLNKEVREAVMVFHK